MASATLTTAIPFARARERDPAEATDAELMARVRDGEAAAFEPLVERHRRRLYGYFLNLTRDPEAASDLAQETFLRVFRAAPRYREAGRFEAWLFRIASNLVRSRNRRRPRIHLQVEGDEEDGLRDEVALSTAPEQSPEAEAFRGEMRDALRDALALVPLPFREAVLLRDVEGWSYREIATMTGVEEGTIKSRAHRGRMRLKALIAPYLRGTTT